MKIELEDIEHELVTFDERMVLERQRLGASEVAGAVEAQIAGEIRPIGGGWTVLGRIEALGTLACSRCLEPVPWNVVEHFDVTIQLASTAPAAEDVGLDEEDLDVMFVDDGELDLEQLAAEQILLALPMRVVCKDDCAGLCPRCGANRNGEEACGCEPEIDPRWEGLKNIDGGRTDS